MSCGGWQCIPRVNPTSLHEDSGLLTSAGSHGTGTATTRRMPADVHDALLSRHPQRSITACKRTVIQARPGAWLSLSTTARLTHLVTTQHWSQPPLIVPVRAGVCQLRYCQSEKLHRCWCCDVRRQASGACQTKETRHRCCRQRCWYWFLGRLVCLVEGKVRDGALPLSRVVWCWSYRDVQLQRLRSGGCRGVGLGWLCLQGEG